MVEGYRYDTQTKQTDVTEYAHNYSIQRYKNYLPLQEFHSEKQHWISVLFQVTYKLIFY